MGIKKDLNKVRLTWELPTETKVFKEENGEQPFVLSKEYTLSMHEKASLRKMLESWRGKAFTDEESKAFDILKLLGIPCMVNVIHKPTKAGNVFADIASVSPMPKGFICPDQINQSVMFSVDEFDSTVFETFPDFLKDKIKSSYEYKYHNQPNHTEAAVEVVETISEESDDFPF